MKSKFFLVMLVPLVACAAPNRFGGPGRGMGGRGPNAGTCPCAAECPLQRVTLTSPTSLAAAEVVTAVEEERLARDLYLTAFERWNLRVFSHIAAAEARHESALLQVAASAAITAPAAQSGVYTTPDVQRLYRDLLPLVTGSETGALRAAALVEETDITDLRRLIALATDDGTRAVLSNLERASRQHLQAFVRNLRVRGITYAPQVLTAEDYRAITGG